MFISVEDHGLVIVDQDAVLEVPAHRSRGHQALDVAPLAHQVGRRVAMAHPHHVLLDDRALVQIGGRVVRGGADTLHAAAVGLVVGPAAAEGRQEGVVDVDDARRVGLDEVSVENLHVAGQDDQVDLVFDQKSSL